MECGAKEYGKRLQLPITAIFLASNSTVHPIYGFTIINPRPISQHPERKIPKESHFHINQKKSVTNTQLAFLNE